MLDRPNHRWAKRKQEATWNAQVQVILGEAMDFVLSMSVVRLVRQGG